MEDGTMDGTGGDGVGTMDGTGGEGGCIIAGAYDLRFIMAGEG